MAVFEQIIITQHTTGTEVLYKTNIESVGTVQKTVLLSAVHLLDTSH